MRQLTRGITCPTKVCIARPTHKQASLGGETRTNFAFFPHPFQAKIVKRELYLPRAKSFQQFSQGAFEILEELRGQRLLPNLTRLSSPKNGRGPLVAPLVSERILVREHFAQLFGQIDLANRRLGNRKKEGGKGKVP